VSQPNSDMVARLREMIDGEQYQESGDRAVLSAAADALEREAWCEEKKVDVCLTLKGEWMCSVLYAEGGVYQNHYGPTRSAAIDAARGSGK